MNDRPYLEQIRTLDLIGRHGRVRQVLPTAIEADGPALPLGSLCEVESAVSPSLGASADSLLAEVVGITSDRVVLAPLDARMPTFPGARVRATHKGFLVPVGDAFSGRAVDGLGRPIDELGPIAPVTQAPLSGVSSNPLDRVSPKNALVSGVRAIDGLLTLALGQRVGVFAASGVGKTSLMSQLARQVEADRCVICLVGERGREVEALWSAGLSAETKAKTTLVAATADHSAAMRVRAAEYAIALADHWRARGEHVLLLMDSITRLAMALREIGLAAGEPPTVRAYTPSVFAVIPRLVERCGARLSGGAITAIMTVLSETDDIDDPVSELMKSLLDGHIVLSRELAEQGHFPAIDIPRSISRLADEVADAGHRRDAQSALELLSTYEGARTLIESGVYAAGSSAQIDRAIALRPSLMSFLRQGRVEVTTYPEARSMLAKALAEAA